MSGDDESEALRRQFDETMKQLEEDPRLHAMLKELEETKVDFPSSESIENMLTQDGLTPLERCQRAFCQLTIPERTRFIYWMTTYLSQPKEQEPPKKPRKRKGEKPC